MNIILYKDQMVSLGINAKYNKWHHFGINTKWYTFGESRDETIVKSSVPAVVSGGAAPLSVNEGYQE